MEAQPGVPGNKAETFDNQESRPQPDFYVFSLVAPRIEGKPGFPGYEALVFEFPDLKRLRIFSLGNFVDKQGLGRSFCIFGNRDTGLSEESVLSLLAGLEFSRNNSLIRVVQTLKTSPEGESIFPEKLRMDSFWVEQGVLRRHEMTYPNDSAAVFAYFPSEKSSLKYTTLVAPAKILLDLKKEAKKGLFPVQQKIHFKNLGRISKKRRARKNQDLLLSFSDNKNQITQLNRAGTSGFWVALIILFGVLIFNLSLFCLSEINLREAERKQQVLLGNEEEKSELKKLSLLYDQRVHEAGILKKSLDSPLPELSSFCNELLVVADRGTKEGVNSSFKIFSLEMNESYLVFEAEAQNALWIFRELKILYPNLELKNLTALDNGKESFLLIWRFEKKDF